MKLFNGIRKYFDRRRLSDLEKRRIENQEQLNEYYARQEQYDDIIRDETQKQAFLNKLYNIKRVTYTKKMVATIILVSIVDIQLSYLLAFFDKGQVVDGLSNQLCITILGVAFAYMIRAYFDSKAEHANIDNKIKEEITVALSNKIDNVFQAAGINVSAEKFLEEADSNNTNSRSSAGFHFKISGGTTMPTNDDN